MRRLCIGLLMALTAVGTGSCTAGDDGDYMAAPTSALSDGPRSFTGDFYLSYNGQWWNSPSGGEVSWQGDDLVATDSRVELRPLSAAFASGSAAAGGADMQLWQLIVEGLPLTHLYQMAVPDAIFRSAMPVYTHTPPAAMLVRQKGTADNVLLLQADGTRYTFKATYLDREDYEIEVYFDNDSELMYNVSQQALTCWFNISRVLLNGEVAMTYEGWVRPVLRFQSK